MLSRESSLEEIKNVIKACLTQLYIEDPELFNRNERKGVSERCIVFRFAHYLQNKITNFYVDCDFNSSFRRHFENGSHHWQPHSGKSIDNPDGTTTDRFVDIIVHKRSQLSPNETNHSDFICFEIKKWNNYDKKQINKDKNNLRVLTSQYGYVYGFCISIHRIKNKTKWIIYQDGEIINEDEVVFKDETNSRIPSKLKSKKKE